MQKVKKDSQVILNHIWIKVKRERRNLIIMLMLMYLSWVILLIIHMVLFLFLMLKRIIRSIILSFCSIMMSNKKEVKAKFLIKIITINNLVFWCLPSMITYQKIYLNGWWLSSAPPPWLNLINFSATWSIQYSAIAVCMIT